MIILKIRNCKKVLIISHGGISSDGTIICGTEMSSSQSKLAFSTGLARSVKLASLEGQLDSLLHKRRHILQIFSPSKFQNQSNIRRTNVGRKEILSYLGELFSIRFQVNLHSELLDSPDFCWSDYNMEECFDKISKNLDVRSRISVLNKKLDYANELVEILRNHLHEQHSLKLECIIILQ